MLSKILNQIPNLYYVFRDKLYQKILEYFQNSYQETTRLHPDKNKRTLSETVSVNLSSGTIQEQRGSKLTWVTRSVVCVLEFRM